jgi:hypothetical protein
MINKPIDKERFRISMWKVEKLMEDIRRKNTDIERLAVISELKATTYTAGPRARDMKHSIVEDVALKREELQEEKRVKEFELQLARFDLSSELDRLYNHLWPGTIKMIRDYYIEGLDTVQMEKKHGMSYMGKIQKAVG